MVLLLLALGLLGGGPCQGLSLSSTWVLCFTSLGGPTSVFHQLHHASLGAHAGLRANFAGLGCATSCPMKRRLFNTLVTPAASYGLEVWGTQCVGAGSPGMAKLLRVQAAFLRSLCGLPRTVPIDPVFAELAEVPWSMRWWGQVVKFVLRLKAMPAGALHLDVLRDNVQDALGTHGSGNWADQLVRHFRVLRLPPPFASDGSVCIDLPMYHKHAGDRAQQVWEGLHISPRTCPSKGAKLCTYHRWFARAGRVQEPYYELPLSNLSMRRLFRFRLGAHHLPVEMGRRDGHARVARVCPLCSGGHVGDERHLVFECPALPRQGLFIACMLICMHTPGPPCAFPCGIGTRRGWPPAYCSFFRSMMQC